MKNTSLVVVGTGIKFLLHLTLEAEINIKNADKVLYLINNPAMEEWIRKANSCSYSLNSIYFKYKLRRDCYQALTEFILATLDEHLHLCVVIYGHPTVFAQPALQAVIEARKRGYNAKVLPGISAEDCLFADLLIDPGTFGCQSFEATDFLIHKRKADNSSYLILWQVDVVGVLDNPSSHHDPSNTKYLVDYLSADYNLDHEVILYQAAQYPLFNPIIQKFSLCQLPEVQLTSISTLCIPPAKKSSYDENTINNLKIKMNDLKGSHFF